MPHVCKSFKEKIAIHASIPHSNLSQTTVNISMQGYMDFPSTVDFPWSNKRIVNSLSQKDY